MAYSLEADVRRAFNTDRITSLSDDNADATADAGIIDGLIDDADGYIWSHVRAHYSTLDPASLTPGTDVPQELRWASTQYTVVLLMRRQGLDARALAEEVERWLDKVANGDIALDAATTRLPDSTTRGRAKVFSDKSLDRMGEPAPGSTTDNNDFFVNQDPSANEFL